MRENRPYRASVGRQPASCAQFSPDSLDAYDGVQVVVGRVSENVEWEALWMAGVIHSFIVDCNGMTPVPIRKSIVYPAAPISVLPVKCTYDELVMS